VRPEGDKPVTRRVRTGKLGTTMALRSEMDWLVRPDPREAASLTLVCFPYAGGGASAWRGWSDSLPTEVEVLGVQPPGREQRLLEPAFDELEPLLEAIVWELAPALTRPFAFFGHSLGALLAYEVAHVLRRRAGEPRYLFVSGLRAPHLPLPWDPIHRLPDRAVIDELRRLGGTPPAVLDHDEMMELVLPPLRADLAVCETYTYRPRPRLRCPIAAFAGVTDPSVTTPEIAAWREHTDGEFTLQLFPSDHFFLQHSRTPLLAAVSECLHPLLAPAAQVAVARRGVG